MGMGMGIFEVSWFYYLVVLEEKLLCGARMSQVLFGPEKLSPTSGWPFEEARGAIALEEPLVALSENSYVLITVVELSYETQFGAALQDLQRVIVPLCSW